MSSIEYLLYKLLIDLFSTFELYGFYNFSFYIYSKKKNQTRFTTQKYDKNSFLNKYLNLNTADCYYDDIIYMSSIWFKCDIDNITVEYSIDDIFGDLKIKYNSTVNVSSTTKIHIEKNINIIQNTLKIYKKLYNKIIKFISNSIFDDYSKCYVYNGYVNSSISDIRLKNIYKYNLFQININSIDNQEDKKTINILINQ